MKRRTKGNVGAWPNMRDDTLKAIAGELVRARKKHPTNARNVEMIRNYGTELLDTFFAYDRLGKSSASQIYAVAQTVAAMAIRIMEEGDGASKFQGNTTPPFVLEPTK